MQNSLNSSFDGTEELPLDVNPVITELPDVDEDAPIKKLSDMFDSCIKPESHMKVYLRVRPTSKSESTISVESETAIVTNAPDSSKRAQYTKTEERHYSFNRVFGPESIQADVFDQSVNPLLGRFFHGENALLFAYGMTNAGKTYTIQGPPQDPGILPRLVNAIMTKMGPKSTVQMSMLEIYQEKIYDLLSRRKEKLNIRDGNGKVEVAKLSAHAISSVQDSMRLMDTAALARSKSHTSLNSGSSRSHAVYSINFNRMMDGKMTSSVFHVVDLAGAERGNRTKATQTQQKEANNINTSLMQLWRCLHNMKRKNSDTTNADIIPFRESKLTHLLMPLLCRAGLAGVAMITCVNPQEEDYDETLSILGNASLASKIREIADISRLGSTSSSIGSSTSSGTASTRSSALASMPEEDVAPSVVPKAKAETKKRRHEATTVKSTITSSSRISQAQTNAAAAMAKARSRAGTGASALKRGSSYVSAGSLPSVAEAAAVKGGDDSEEAETEDGSERKRLRVEVNRLRAENAALTAAQLVREAEIREEVSEEVRACSADLLGQLEALQTELEEKDALLCRNDVTKSCKKVRKRQLEQANEDTARSLEESEEELERVRATFDAEISQLKNENSKLMQSVAEWRSKAEGATRALEALQATAIALNPIASMQVDAQATDSTTEGAAAVAAAARKVGRSSAVEFSQRMQRDARFQKTDTDSGSQNGAAGSGLGLVSVGGSTVEMVAGVPVLARSPSRSPLGPLRHDGNSPIRLEELNMSKKPSGKSKSTKSKPAADPVVDENSCVGRASATATGPNEVEKQPRALRTRSSACAI